jgi:hypothetical protein
MPTSVESGRMRVRRSAGVRCRTPAGDLSSTTGSTMTWSRAPPPNQRTDLACCLASPEARARACLLEQGRSLFVILVASDLVTPLGAAASLAGHLDGTYPPLDAAAPIREPTSLRLVRA